jgi:hypothetical protein
MKHVKLTATIALLLFVGATVGVLIAQEVSQTAVESPGTQLSSDSPGGAMDATTSLETSTQSVAAETSAADTQESQESTVSDSGDIQSEPLSTEAVSPEAQPDCVVDAIYFHNTLRCHTCRTIEATAKTVLEAEFSEEFATGQLRWSAINMEEQRHFVEEFDLVQPTLVLVRSVGDVQTDWVALGETWSLIRSELRFKTYIENETGAFLGGCR